ncbi:MAG TPA: tRNA (adenosine(37)-N6)-threonylcarbamoyltransferase complex transferase subunit TsaD, partial [Pirellulales bacterium]|nr:tRNA (adenosine(37)-N6)-threonylcarbamoyltransferase complex transferase subunit TsaD [Pirellulales bacterium]
EAFDKVASLLALPYPGGPAIQKAAEQGDPRAFPFPRSFIHDDERLEFSFSGLKTAVRYAAFGSGAAECNPAALDRRKIADLAASFQEAVVDVLSAKARHALRSAGCRTLCVGGGVAANRRLRERLEAIAAADGFSVYIAPLELCTDNAVMGAIAVERLKAGLVEDLDLDVQPGLIRARQAVT